MGFVFEAALRQTLTPVDLAFTETLPTGPVAETETLPELGRDGTPAGAAGVDTHVALEDFFCANSFVVAEVAFRPAPVTPVAPL
ncbi:MAG: hypothetical protein ACYCSF_05055 [Acidimicrobiales bacterium]